MSDTMTTPTTSSNSESSIIEMWLAEDALSGQTRFVPDAMISTILRWRREAGATPDPKQTREYVLHVVRNAPHVCRHQITEGTYRIHTNPECSPECKEAWKQERRTLYSLPTCGGCFTTPSSNGTCLC